MAPTARRAPGEADPAAGGEPAPDRATAPAPGGAAATAAGASPPAAPPPPAAAAASGFAPAPGGRVQVQLGALASEEAARAEWERLMRRMPDLLGAFRPQILRLERGEGAPPLWRLRIGGFADPAAARAFCEQARGRGAACAVAGG
nr:SPOR domain-containing protein [Caldovatus aquaticus]